MLLPIVYDANGNLADTIDPLGNTSSIAYNSYGQPLTLTDAKGNVTTNEYDVQGNLIKVTDALGNKTIYSYDGIGRRMSTTDAKGNTTSFTYDNNENLLTVADPLGGITTHTYDANNNRATVTDPRGNTASYSYDENDLLTTVTDALGNVIRYSYDSNDRKISVQDALGNITQYAYDGVGNMVQMKDALNNTTTYTYDANGNTLTETNPLGQTTTYTYDTLNRVVSVADTLGNTTTNTYDALGRITNTTNAKGQTTSYVYDAMGRLTKVTDTNGGTVLYSYDKNGNRTTMTEPNGNTISYTYDALNRLVQKVEPIGNAHQYTYDAIGNRKSLTDAKGNTINYTYDSNNRLTAITYPDASTVTLAYDANGNRTQMVDSLGTTTYTYDALNRMTSNTDSFGKTVSYGYDVNGNRTSITYPGGKVVNYAYDTLNRLKTVTDWLTNTTNYTYDKSGNLTGILNPNNTTAIYTYDAAGRLTGMDNTKSDSTVICSYSYTLDAIGNHIQTVQHEPLPPIFTNLNMNYTHDAENRLTDTNGTANTFDANGNMTGKGSDSYSYDYEDRLIQSTIAGVVTQYRYDGMGNRLAKIEGSTTTRYVLDINGSLSNVLAETDASGNINAYYIHGLGLISKVLPDGTVYYYHYDSRGSTVALTNSGENITDTYAYDPFGKLANSTGATTNPFKYVGRYGVMDERNGLEYIRARYYSPELGRFIKKDLLTGSGRESQSLNRYVYALNNSVNTMDISGFNSFDNFFSGAGREALNAIKEAAIVAKETVITAKEIIIDTTANEIYRGFEWIDRNPILGIPFPKYKNYGAPGHTAGGKTIDVEYLSTPRAFAEIIERVPPKDQMDLAFAYHDYLYLNAKNVMERSSADDWLVQTLKNIPDTSLDDEGRKYKNLALWFFRVVRYRGIIVETGKNMGQLYVESNTPVILEILETQGYKTRSFKK